MYFDSHCHLDFDAYDGNRERIWQQARAVGVTQVVIPGVCPAQWHKLPSLCRTLEGSRHAVGLHPWWIEESIDALSLEASLRKAALGAAAIGETGLDQTARAQRIPLDRQLVFLEIHLRVANELGLPVIFHSVRAHEAMLDVLARNAPRAGGVVHSFSGSHEILKCYLEHDLYISFSCSALRFSEKKCAAIAQVPANRLLVETDAPDQSADRSRLGAPLDVIKVAERVAEARGSGLQDVANTTRSNAERLFGVTSETQFTM